VDLTTLSDDDLAAHLDAVLAEQERRTRLATIPGQVAALAQQYVDGGGSVEDLAAAIQNNQEA